MTIEWHKLILDEMENFLRMAHRPGQYNRKQFEKLASKNKEKLIEMFEEQQEENKRLREALEFYANENNFKTFDSPAIKDYGEKARKALEESE